MTFEEFLVELAKVETLTQRDKLIMAHAYEIGFRIGVESIIKIKESK